MKVIALANNKGGVAKTTSAHNIAAALERASYRVLIMDLDAQESLTRCLGIETELIQKNVGHFILGKASLEDCAMAKGKLVVLPADKSLLGTEYAIRASPKYPQNLKISLKPYHQDFDFVILDCPPSLSVFTHIALVACDFYLVPLQVEFLSYEGLREFLSYAAEIEELYHCRLAGVFATRYNPKQRDTHGKSVVKNTAAQLEDDFLETFIRNNNALSKAQLARKSIFDYDAESNGAQDYQKLTEEILKRIA